MSTQSRQRAEIRDLTSLERSESIGTRTVKEFFDLLSVCFLIDRIMASEMKVSSPLNDISSVRDVVSRALKISPDFASVRQLESGVTQNHLCRKAIRGSTPLAGTF